MAGACTSSDILRKAFSTFDKDGNGKLSATELIGILTRSGGGTPLSRADAQAIIADFDTDADGHLDLEEFVKAFSGEVGVMGLVHVHASAGSTYELRDSRDVTASSVPIAEKSFCGNSSVMKGSGAVQTATGTMKYRSFSALTTPELRRFESGGELRPYLGHAARGSMPRMTPLTPGQAATSIQAVQRGRTVRRELQRRSLG